jgi:hypothetical protein
MNVSAMGEFIIHPSKLTASEAKTIEFYYLFNAYSVFLHYLHYNKYCYQLHWNQGHQH